MELTNLYTVNVVVTGRCNTNCSYCHYYSTRDRTEYSYDISDSLFETYMYFIVEWSKRVNGHLTYRFSGGDPLVLGDRLFDLADRAFATTGTKPFLLTAGKALSHNWASKARQSHLSHVFVSVENPFEPDPGAPDPFVVVKAINDCHSEELPIVPGVCVVPNHCFTRLYDICSWFYDQIGRIPIISEVNYSAYTRPTEQQWFDLADNLSKIISAFYNKTYLNLFPYVSPELSYGSYSPFIFELDLENSYGMDSSNYTSKVDDVMRKLLHINYPPLDCKHTACNWHDFCSNTKWFWQGDKNNSFTTKASDYCRFKKILNDAYYKVLVDSQHTPSAHTFMPNIQLHTTLDNSLSLARNAILPHL
jgi:hypothetical protein